MSYDVCTDAIAETIQKALGDELPDAHENTWIHVATEVMKVVDRPMLLHQPGTVGEEAL